MSQPKPYEPERMEPERMTEEGRKEFVLGVLQNHIFTSAHLQPHEDPSMVFFPILFGALAPPTLDLPEPPETIPEDWTVEQFEAYPEKHAKLKEIAERVLREDHEHYVKHIGGFWEYNSKALPRSINGLPCFMSMNVMHIEDWKLTSKVIVAEQERMEKLRC